MLEITNYRRKNYAIEAVRVTEDNLEDVAAWCEGSISHHESGTVFVVVPVKQPKDVTKEKWLTRAYVGRWVIRSKFGFRVYNHGDFHYKFYQPGGRQEMKDLVAKIEAEFQSSLPKRDFNAAPGLE